MGTKITRIEETIEQQMRPFQKAVNTWLTFPGIKHRLAWTLVDEVGPTVEAFPSAGEMVSWAGVCPGNNKILLANGRAAPRALVIRGYVERCVRLPGPTNASTGVDARDLSAFSGTATPVRGQSQSMLHSGVGAGVVGNYGRPRKFMMHCGYSFLALASWQLRPEPGKLARLESASTDYRRGTSYGHRRRCPSTVSGR